MTTTTTKLHPPFIITPRLMAGLQIGGAFISMGSGPRNSEGRTVYGCFIDLPDGTEHEITDLRSGCGGGDLVEGFVSLLTFLEAAADSYGLPSENPARIVEWAAENEDGISLTRLEIEESETKLIESK